MTKHIRWRRGYYAGDAITILVMRDTGQPIGCEILTIYIMFLAMQMAALMLYRLSSAEERIISAS